MEDQNVVGEMTLWGNRERNGQGLQRTEKVGKLWRRAAFCSGWTQSRIEQNRTVLAVTEAAAVVVMFAVVEVVVVVTVEATAAAVR